MNHFSIIICAYNAEKWIEKSILSAVTQNYKQFEVLVVDANSTDNTYNICKNLESKFTNLRVFKNEVRKFPLENIKYLTTLSKEKSICVTLDGDDWFKNEDVLNSLNSVYTNDVWMTYGTYEEYPYRNVSKLYGAYPDEVIKNNSFREHKWLASHLRTHRRELFLKIKDEDLKYTDGKYMDYAADLAIQYPMMEMSGERIRHISDILYVYNRTNPISECHRDTKRNDEIVKYVVNKQKYTRLSSL